MVIKIFYFVVCVFSVAMVYMTLQDPYYSELLKPDNTIASMQINDAIDHELNATVISARYETDEWNRYKNMDEFVKFRAEILRDDNLHNISSQKAFYQDDELKFAGDVRYINSENLKFTSQEVIYDTKTKVARSDVPFIMTQNGDKIIGNSLIYDTIEKKTYAKGIEAWVQEKR